MEKKFNAVTADAIRGVGQIEAFTISSMLNAGDDSRPLMRDQLREPLSTSEIELMLSNQAILLNAVGNRQTILSSELAMIASSDKSRDASDRYLKNGFKAFELSRKCLATLNEVRNPKRSATFVKQQLNQINVGDQHGGAKVDRITESKATGFDPNMATLETLDRCEVVRG